MPVENFAVFVSNYQQNFLSNLFVIIISSERKAILQILHVTLPWPVLGNAKLQC